MKWLSVKKFRPPSCTDVFIRVTNGEYDRYFVGMIESFPDINDFACWELANGCEEAITFNRREYAVTHFAIIDPVEIED